MGVYDRQVLSAKQKIKAKGQVVVWRQQAKETVDPDKPWIKEPGEAVDFSVQIAFVPIGTKDNEKLSLMKTNPEVVIASLKGLMASVEFVPSLKDVVIRGGVSYRIYAIDEVNVNGESILFKVFLE